MFCSSVCINSGSVQKFLQFFVCPEFLKYLHIDPKTVENVLASDFCCGYISAILSIFIVLILLIAVRILMFLIFRTKRCSRIIVPSSDGDLIVTRNAVEAVIRKELSDFPQISLRKLLMFKRGQIYSLKIFCGFERSGEGIPEITQALKPRLKEVMKELFGIESMNEITICIERLEQDDDDNENEDNGKTAVINNFHDHNTGI